MTQKKYVLLKSPNGFTLIELLIAVTIFMILTGMTAKLLTTLSDLGEKSIAVVELHQQAGDLLNVFTNDFRNMHLSTAFSLGFEDPLKPQSTFMTNEKKEQGKTGGSYGPYSIAKTTANIDFMWARWECDFMRGLIKRGRSNAPSAFTFSASNEGSIHKTSQKYSSGISRFQSFATPQTEMVYFEGEGTAKSGNTNWAWNADSAIQPKEKRRMHQHCEFETRIPTWNGANADPKFFKDRLYKYYLYNHATVGNKFELSNDCYAVKNPDGLTYNKDRLFLVGSDDTTTNVADPESEVELYPNQLRPLGTIPNIECAILSYHMADGSIPVDDDTLNDGSVSLDIKGTGPQLRQAATPIINNRPDYVTLSFLLHNIPLDDPDLEDIDGDPTTNLFITALRNKIHQIDGAPLTTNNYVNEMENRQVAMLDLILKYGYIAQQFDCSVALAK